MTCADGQSSTRGDCPGRDVLRAFSVGAEQAVSHIQPIAIRRTTPRLRWRACISIMPGIIDLA
jgi:hypothetical protein